MSVDIYADDTDFADELSKDSSGVTLRLMKDALAKGCAEAKMKLDQGVAPDEFKAGQLLLDGYAAALRGLDAAWERRHPK